MLSEWLGPCQQGLGLRLWVFLEGQVSEVIGPAAANRPEVTSRGVYQIKHLEGVT